MRLLIAFIILTSIFLSSCFRESYRTFHKVNVQSEISYEVKGMAGCCGCKALFYNVYKNSLLSEQVVAEVRCGLFQPTKHVFTTNLKGKVIAYKSFVAVTDSSFTLPVTELDKAAFAHLDSLNRDWAKATPGVIVFSAIKGFKEGGKPHMPLNITLSKNLTK